MPFDIGALAQQTAGGVIGAGMGLLLEDHNDRRQLRQQGKLQAQQIQGQKEMSQFNYEQQMKMWEATNYGPQMEQLKKAGLNPGLIYGMKGGGGATTGAAPGQIQGASAPQGGGETMGGIGMGIGAAMAAANIELTKAQTEKTKAETVKTTGVDTTEAQTRIASLTQGITNAKAQEGLMRVEQILKEMQAFEQQKSQGDRMDYIAFQTGRAMQELEKAMAESFVARETQNQKIEIIRQEAIGAAIKNTLMEAQVNATNAQIQKWAQEISQGWKSIDQKDKEIVIKTFEAEIRAAFPGISQSLGRILTGAMDEIADLTTGRDASRRQEYKVKPKEKP